MNESNQEIVEIDKNSDYFKGAELLSAQNSSNLVSNGRIEHAAVLFLLMLKRCTKSVIIVSDRLKEAFYTNVEIAHAIEDAIARGITLAVLVRNDPDQASLNRLKELKASGRISVRKLQKQTLVNDFAVFDGQAFRFEEPGSHSAVASFNRPDLAQILKSKFEMVLIESRDLLNAPAA